MVSNSSLIMITVNLEKPIIKSGVGQMKFYFWKFTSTVPATFERISFIQSLVEVSQLNILSRGNITLLSYLNRLLDIKQYLII